MKTDPLKARSAYRAVERACLILVLLLRAATARAEAPPTEPQLRIEAGMHIAPIKSISADAAGRYAVTASDDKTARIWDLISGRLLGVLRPPIAPGNEGKLYAVAMSPDGRFVAASGWTGYAWDQKDSIYLFDRTSGRLLHRLSGLPEIINQLSFSQDGQYLAAVLGGGFGLRVWPMARLDTAGASWVDTAYGDRSCGVAWSTDGRLATSGWDGQIRLYRPEASGLNRLAVVTAPGGRQPQALAFSPITGELAVGYQDSSRVDLLDGNTLALRTTPSSAGVEKGNLASVAWSADGQSLLAGGSANAAHDPRQISVIRIWAQSGRGAFHDVPVSGNSITELQALPDGHLLAAGAEPTWGQLDSTTIGPAAWRRLGFVPTADLRGQFDRIALSADGTTVQFGFESGGASPYRFSLAERHLQPGADATLSAARNKGLDVRDWHDTSHPSLAGAPLKLKSYEMSRSLAIAPDASGFALGAEWWLRYFTAQGNLMWTLPAPSTAWAVNIPASGQVVVAAYGDGTIRWHRRSDGQELLAFFPSADRKRWVLWTPSGYYDASPGGEDLIGWHLNNGADAAADFFPVGKFRERFYRPDVIDRVLATLDENQAVAQANAARGTVTVAPVSVAQVLPPVVDLLSGNDLHTDQSSVTVRVQARAPGDAPVTGWQVRVNGQLQPEARGLNRADAADTNVRELNVSLPPQDSLIEIFANNRNGSSVPAQVRVSWTSAAPKAIAGATAPPAGAAATASSGDFKIMPKLYVLAVGVAHYQNAAIPVLGLPAKDAEDFAAALKAQNGKLYGAVEVKLLTDAGATAGAVIDGLDWLQRQVTQHDVGIVFLAGHGVNDPVNGYTFLPVDADPDHLRRTGVAMDEFKKTMSNLTGKAVFFLDTCHSGNVLGAKSRGIDNDVAGVINELSSAENGVVVFSSSTGRQYSFEDPAWGNGAFTKALVEGLGGQADYQKSGRITYKMLDLYVSDRVKALTHGQQSPVTQAPGGVPDFPLAMVK